MTQDRPPRDEGPNPIGTYLQDLEEVYTASDPIEVSVVTGILEDAGLQPKVRDLSVRPYPVSIGPLGEKRVAVPTDQAAEARQLLQAAVTDGVLADQGRILPGDH